MLCIYPIIFNMHAYSLHVVFNKYFGDKKSLRCFLSSLKLPLTTRRLRNHGTVGDGASYGFVLVVAQNQPEVDRLWVVVSICRFDYKSVRRKEVQNMSEIRNETLMYLEEHFPQILDYVPDDVLEFGIPNRIIMILATIYIGILFLISLGGNSLMIYLYIRQVLIECFWLKFVTFSNKWGFA